jgi:hypothetical protein
MRQPRQHRLVAPGLFFDGVLDLALDRFGEADQTVGGIRVAVEHDVFDQRAQLGRDFVVDAQLPGVDDAHVHAGLDRVVEEYGVDRLAHRLVATERERHVGDAAGDMRVRQVLADPARRLDEVDGVVGVFLDAGGDGEDVRVEDDVFRREADLFGEQLVGARADFDLARVGVGLAGSSKAMTMTAAP